MNLRVTKSTTQSGNSGSTIVRAKVTQYILFTIHQTLRNDKSNQSPKALSREEPLLLFQKFIHLFWSVNAISFFSTPDKSICGWTLTTHHFGSILHVYQFNAPISNLPYLTNISTAVSCMFLFIPFQDFLSLKTCLASRGSLGSVSGGASGSGRGSRTTDSLSLDFLLIKLDVTLRCIPLLFLPPIVNFHKRHEHKNKHIRSFQNKNALMFVLKIDIAVTSFSLVSTSQTRPDSTHEVIDFLSKVLSLPEGPPAIKRTAAHFACRYRYWTNKNHDDSCVILTNHR